MRGRTGLRVALKVVLVLAALRALGAVVARRGNRGDAGADDFELAAVFDGAERVSHAASLRRGRVLACFGGVQLDLREATLDPAGADLHVRACLGGVQVIVPEDWDVAVVSKARAGGVSIQVSDPARLAPGAPSLRVEAEAWLGGVQVTTEDDDEDEPDADR